MVHFAVSHIIFQVETHFQIILRGATIQIAYSSIFLEFTKGFLKLIKANKMIK